MTEDIKFVIPSFQRPQKFQEKTLNYLLKHKVPKQQIYTFLRSDDPQLTEYLKIKEIVHVISDIKGIGNTHNYITEYFQVGDFIVEIDDDLLDLIDKNKKSVEDFLQLCYKMKMIMLHMGISYGGTYQCDNVMFMSQCAEFTTDLRYMLGCLRFRFIRKNIRLSTNYAEDFENCILHYIMNGKILKNNWIAPKTNNYSEGGCDGDGRNIETEKADKELLAKVYPNYCKLFQRKNGRWDLKLSVSKKNLSKNK
tara:strand:- start:14381 stop:15136 length:756 start_codon:yes stop_codon:yes gene_type:complete